jgi:hypothetical protein
MSIRVKDEFDAKLAQRIKSFRMLDAAILFLRGGGAAWTSKHGLQQLEQKAAAIQGW